MPKASPTSRGTLTRWNDDRGFGFIRPDDGGPDVFLHISALSGERRPQDGDTISYRLNTGADGKPRATAAQISALASPNRASAGAAPAAGRGAFPVLPLVLLLALPLAGATTALLQAGTPLPLILYLLLSLASFALYADDKRRARSTARRTPELTLHLVDLLGGWPGGFAAQRMLYHKNRKSSFQLIFWISVALHLLGWGAWLLLGERLLDRLG